MAERRAWSSPLVAARMLRDAERIAGWAREAGSAGERAAFAQIEQTLAEAGVATTREESHVLVSLPGAASVDCCGERLPAIAHALAAPTPTGGLSAPLVLAAAADPARWRGALVAFDGLAGARAVRQAETAGAAGALFLSRDAVPHEMVVSDVWGAPGAAEAAALPRIPAASLGAAAAERLRAGAATAGDAHVRLEAAVDTRWRRLPCLVAEIRAESSADDRFVLFSGHVDAWQRGAMDNAGANAAMVELARHFQRTRARLRRDLRIAFWSGHSQARYGGSAAWVDAHWAALDRGCVVHVNVDSIGGAGERTCALAPSMPDTHAVGAAAVAAVAGERLGHVPMPRAGDQSLVNLGVSSLFITLSELVAGSPEAARDQTGLPAADGEPAGGGLGWWWHTPHDTPERLDGETLLRDAEIYRRVLDRFACDPVVPLDVAASTAALLAEARALAAACDGRFDLSAVVTEAARLAQAAAALYAAAAAVTEAEPPQRVAELERAIVAVARTATRLLHVEGDRFGHDPAGAGGTPLPLLAPARELARAAAEGDAARRAVVDLRRRRNRVLAELREAVSAATLPQPSRPLQPASPP